MHQTDQMAMPSLVSVVASCSLSYRFLPWLTGLTRGFEFAGCVTLQFTYGMVSLLFSIDISYEICLAKLGRLSSWKPSQT